MPSTKDETEKTKNRIIEVATKRFSAVGFDATRVDDIAKDAGINKALIYYYFKSKEDILNHLIERLFDDISSIVMEFIKNNIVPMLEKGQLDVHRDHWTFISVADAQTYHDALMRYYEKIVDFTLSHRRIIRILIFESLKSGKHHSALFYLQDLIYNREKSLFYQTVWNPDQELTYSSDHIVFKFFFGFIPIFNFAAYFDDYVASDNMEEIELRASFLRAYQKMESALFNGKDIIL